MHEPYPQPATPASTLEDAVAGIAAGVAALGGSRHHPATSATLWRDDVVVTTARARWRDRHQALLLPSGDTAQAELLGQDAGTDLAVLRLEAGAAGSTPPWVWADARAVRAGRFVFAVARESNGLHSASFGYVASAAGAWRSWRGGNIDRFIRLDGGLYAGFAGAPLADASGALIGIATPNLSRHWGMVLPASTVQRVVDEIVTHGFVARGYLGVALQPVELADSVVAACELPHAHGLLVSTVAKGGPAQRAGLLVGDVIVGLDGRDIGQIDSAYELIEGRRPGTAVQLSVVRGSQRQALSVELAARPPGHGGQHAGCRP